MKKKLNLTDLKVRSFLTDLDESQKDALNGGCGTTECYTDKVHCPLKTLMPK